MLGKNTCKFTSPSWFSLMKWVICHLEQNHHNLKAAIWCLILVKMEMSSQSTWTEVLWQEKPEDFCGFKNKHTFFGWSLRKPFEPSTRRNTKRRRIRSSPVAPHELGDHWLDQLQRLKPLHHRCVEQWSWCCSPPTNKPMGNQLRCDETGCFGAVKWNQPKQCTMKGKSLKFTIDLHS